LQEFGKKRESKNLNVLSNRDRKQDGFNFPLDLKCLVGFRSCSSNIFYNKTILKQIKRCSSNDDAAQEFRTNSLKSAEFSTSIFLKKAKSHRAVGIRCDMDLKISYLFF
tara:strand:+ start:1628 stop:1954 length:327 start_codon:yes stop_codon:yes gene_type:complete